MGGLIKMPLEVVEFENYEKSVKELRNNMPSMRVNLEARMSDTHLWHKALDSRTVTLYGCRNQDGRLLFKIDHAFDMERVFRYLTCKDEYFAPDEYHNSEGTEFVIIDNIDIEGATRAYFSMDPDYAIRADKYQNIRDKLSQGKIKVEDLEEAGGFRIGLMREEEARKHEGWLELFVGKSNASQDEYAEASKLLNEYVSMAKEKGCFSRGREYWGMDFIVGKFDTYSISPWFVSYNNIDQGRSKADCRKLKNTGASFLLEVEDTAEENLSKEA